MTINQQPPKATAEPVPDQEPVLRGTSYQAQVARTFNRPAKLAALMGDVAEQVMQVDLNHLMNRAKNAGREPLLENF